MREAVKKISILAVFALFAAFNTFAADEEALPAEEAIEERIISEESKAESKSCNDEGLSLLQEQEREEAIESFKRAIELDPGNAEAYKNLGLVYSWQSRYDDAISVFKSLIDAVPDYLPGYRNLILIYNINGSYKEAIPYAEKAIEYNPDDLAVMGYLIYDYVNTGEYEKSIEYSQKLIEKNPDRPKAYRYLAIAYDGLERLDEAKEAFEKYYNMTKRTTINKDAPENRRTMEALFGEMRAETLYFKGDRALQNGDMERGLAYSRESIKLNPDDHRPYYNIAKLYDVWGENDNTLEYLKKAIELNPPLLDDIMKSSEFGELKDTEEFRNIFGE